MSLASTTNANQWDPIQMKTPAQFEQSLVYDTLLRPQLDRTYQPGLAKSATITNPNTILIHLQPNIKFSDGTPLDAEAVQFSLMRNVASHNPQPFATELQDLTSVTVNGPLTATLNLSAPIAGEFYSFLGRGETFIVSPTAVKNGINLNQHPVGAGPFLLKSDEPGVQVQLVKNPNYFESSQVRLAGVDFIDAETPQAITNALKSGAVDVGNVLTLPTAQAVAGGNIQTRVTPGENAMLWGQTCKSRAPLNNLMVRRALEYGVNRHNLNQLVFQGKGKPLYGLFLPSNPNYDKSLNNAYAYDPKKAKRLLAQAGVKLPLTVTASVTPGDSQNATEVLQQQFAQIGVNLQLIPTQDPLTQALGPNPRTDFYVIDLARVGLDKITRTLVLGPVGDVCNYNDAHLNSLVASVASASATSPQAVTAWARLQEYVWSQALQLFGLFAPAVNAWNARIGGVRFVPNFQGAPFLDVRVAFIKKG
jgi:peptide/nickel transport system substrate-binding protein